MGREAGRGAWTRTHRCSPNLSLLLPGMHRGSRPRLRRRPPRPPAAPAAQAQARSCRRRRTVSPCCETPTRALPAFLP